MTTTSLLPRVAVFAMGGTIAMTDAGGGAVPRVSARELLAAVPGLADTRVDLRVSQFRQAPGASLSYADILSLTQEIVGSDVDGVVVTQGTDTIEETSWLIDLVHSSDIPVVVTGAMRNAGQAGADGPANVLSAVQLAASSAARGLGCVVLLGEEIHAARWVRKVHSTGPAAFSSYPGPIGGVVEGLATVWSRPRRGMPIVSDLVRPEVRTATATLGLGDDGVVLEAIGAKVDGMVVAGFGAGHAPAACLGVLTALASRMPLVLASRTGAGSVLSKTYGFPGSESDLLRRGLIPAGWLDPIKSRVLLHLLLATGVSPETVRQRFIDLAAAATSPLLGTLHA
ncbi:MAG: asparaginase [Dermatophilaceae bacterium]